MLKNIKKLNENNDNVSKMGCSQYNFYYKIFSSLCQGVSHSFKRVVSFFIKYLKLPLIDDIIKRTA